MKAIALIAGLALSASAFAAAHAQQGTAPASPPSTSGNAAAPSQMKQMKSSDRNFVTKAANGGMFEVRSSELAATKAQRSDVKEFAQRMIADHTGVNQNLEQTARAVGATVPAELDAKHKAKIDKLQATQNGKAFDTAYINAQVEAHKEAVDLFKSYARNGQNQQLKTLAADSLPALQEHYAAAQKMKTTGASAASN